MFTQLRRRIFDLSRANIIPICNASNVNKTRTISYSIYHKSCIDNENISVKRCFNQGSSHDAILNNDSPKFITVKRLMSYDNKNDVHNKINDLITKSKNRVFLFMKGVPNEPACRYSGLVVQILDAYGVDYDSFDVLENSDVRQELKNYSDWPTIPQLYVDGSFVGGCDILLQMHQSGELKDLFKTDGPTPPKDSSS